MTPINTSTRNTTGFTLIELMVVVAVIAILAAIALPSYQEHVARSRRADAKQLLLNNAQSAERAFTIANTYVGVSPVASTAFYNIGINTTPTTFQITATRAGSMATDRCGDFVINQAGARTVASGTLAAGATEADCWNR